MRWFESATDVEASQRIPEFWGTLSEGARAGEFWADQIKTLRNDPDKRLAVALDHLPLPHAFKEGAVALRAIIRKARKSKEPFEKYLAWLYWLAAVHSFMIPYANRLREPGYRVMESVPGRVIRSLNFDYSSLGYEKLELLNKTDHKWLVECWGEPNQHSTLNKLCRNVWDEYEDKLIAERASGTSGLKPLPAPALPGRKQNNAVRYWWLGALIIGAAIALSLFR